jgi:pyrimidine operon attenuation protein/uracil phosphoribosyltransferase
MSAQDIERSLSRIALQILENNHDPENLAIVGIHTGGVNLAERIHRIIESRENISLPFGTLDITLYRDDWSLASLNPVVKKTDIQFSVDGKIVVLIDDVIFTGRTIRAALDATIDFGRPRLIQLAVLVDRGGRELPIQPDYTGITLSVRDSEHVHVLLGEDSSKDEVVVKSAS